MALFLAFIRVLFSMRFSIGFGLFLYIFTCMVCSAAAWRNKTNKSILLYTGGNNSWHYYCSTVQQMRICEADVVPYRIICFAHDAMYCT